ncbi:MAG: sigma-70 family RNA polymerase sigma factor [Acidobacteriota bacterium]|nr:MAG: sigma-70 family RNA polymerase sigma factor [Acidobacteriota bacterium]
MVVSDKELILKAQKGDMQAFEDLVYRYDRTVLGIAIKFTGDTDKAQDIYQETFIRVFKAISHFRMESQFSTWLYRIATNVCLTYRSQDRSVNHLSIDDEGEDGAKTAGMLAASLTSNPNSEDWVAGREIVEHVERALRRLSPQQRMVFVLRHYEGHRLKEIAQALECAEGTVKKHLFEATVRMRESLSRFYGSN